MPSPNRAVARATVSTVVSPPGLVRSRTAPSSAARSGAPAAPRTMPAVGTSEVEATVTVRPALARTRCCGSAATSRSSASSRSADSSPTALAPSGVPGPSGSRGHSRRWETTGPAFWLSPVWSRPVIRSPSRNAAVASTWLSVTTPVPPMPVATIPYPPTSGMTA